MTVVAAVWARDVTRNTAEDNSNISNNTNNNSINNNNKISNNKPGPAATPRLPRRSSGNRGENT